MSDIGESYTSPRPPHHAAKALRVLLGLGSLVILVGGCILAAMAASMHYPAPIQDNLLAFGVVLAAIFLAGVLLAASWIVGSMGELQTRALEGRPQDDVRPAIERLEQALRLTSTLQTRSEPRTITEPAASSINIVGATRHPGAIDELRDLMLMNDEQRKNFAERHWQHRKRAHLDAIEREVLVGDWSSAFARLDELSIVIPGDSQVHELRERVESEQAARLEEDVRATRARLRPLMTAGMWPQAETLADSLRGKYPGRPEADGVIEDVRRERDAWERANSDRLFRDISAANQRRQWRGAVLAIDEFIRRYPLDPRSDALRLDLPTLQENAATHERKEAEEKIKDLVKQQRVAEAISLGESIVQKYPQSPTAAELNKLLPRLRDLAKQEAARVAAQPPQNAAPVGATA